MNKWSVVALFVYLLPAVGRGGELLVGGGYGTQVGRSGDSQNNGVVDAIYNCYAIDREPWHLTLGAGVSWLWNDADNEDLLIASIIPTLRLDLTQSERFTSYIFVGTGLAYLTEPRLGHQVLGGYFAFNDYFGLGTYVGRERRWSVNLCWRHISNAGIFNPNNGIDVPFCLLVGRQL